MHCCGFEGIISRIQVSIEKQFHLLRVIDDENVGKSQKFLFLSRRQSCIVHKYGNIRTAVFMHARD